MPTKSVRHFSANFARFFLLALVFLFVTNCTIFAEQFRVKKSHQCTLSTSTNETILLGYNDLLLITIPQDTTFIKGIELAMQIPEQLLNEPSCLAYSFYTNFSKSTKNSTIDFSGERIAIDMLPSRLSMVLQIPLDDKQKLEETPYAALLDSCYIGTSNSNKKNNKVDDLASAEQSVDKIIALRLQPIMKGLPENINELSFATKVKPLLANEGLLELGIKYPTEEKKAISVFIDEKPVQDFEKELFLPLGMHHIAISGEDYRTEVRTFMIEQAKTTKLEIALVDASPMLFVSAPDGAQVFLDGERIVQGKNAVTVQAGEHTIRMLVGDYELTKTITLVNGKNYNLALTIDMALSEAP